MTPPKGTLTWTGTPTASQPVQPTQSPTPPSGSLKWTNSPTYSAADLFDVPQDTRTTTQMLQDVLGYTPNIKRQEEIAQRYVEGKSSAPEMVTQSAMNTVGAFLAPVVKGISKVGQAADYVLSGKGKYNPIPENNAYSSLKTGVENAYGKSVSAISDMPSMQNMANTEQSKSFEEYLRGANDLLAIAPLPKVAAGTNKVMSAAEEYALQQMNKFRGTGVDNALQKTVNQIKQVEKVGRGAKTAYTPKDELVLTKIAQSNVLPQTVDNKGTIDATKIKTAQQQYLEQPIGMQEDGTPITVRNAESVVGRLLENEKATANINEVIDTLKSAVENSNLPADVMKTAIERGVPKFAEALMKYADEFGNILLDKLHTEKIRTTTGLDYTKPLAKTYRKALASGLKTIIENKSKYPIKEINQELALHLEAVKRIGQLAGKKVEGGRLGTHVARGVGTGLGIVLGKVAGPVGATIGGAVGGELGAMAQSAKMQRTFGKQGESVMPGSPLLEQASIEANKPIQRDLTVADKAVGASKSIPKNKEVLRLERAIKENVAAQKEAIKAKDFELVAKLKKIYDLLVEKLKIAIKKIKDTPNKQGGFIVGSPSKSPTPSGQTIGERIASQDDTTHLAKAQALHEEALKYKTAEEFVNNKINVFHATNEAQAKSIESVGFKPSLGRGFSNQPGDFAFFTPSVDGAIRYSKTSANGLNKVTSGHLKGNILKIDGVKADFEAFGEASRKLGVPLGKDSQGNLSMLDIEGLKNALRENGYSAIEFKDRYSNGARAIAAIPEDVKTKSQLTDIWNKAHSAADDLVNQAKKYKTAEAIKEWNDGFWKINKDAKVVDVPIDEIGRSITIRQKSVTEKGVKEWMTRIENGERPTILAGIRENMSKGEIGNRPLELTILDGNHRLEAYRRLGFKNVPVLDNTPSSQLTDIWNKAHSAADDLVNQAKKYKTAEEFVKAQEKDILFHGTSSEIPVDKLLGRKLTSEQVYKLMQGSFHGDRGGKGIYLTRSYDKAGDYAFKTENPNIVALKPKGELNLLNVDGGAYAKDIMPIKKEAQKMFPDLDEGPALTKYLEKKGYDGINYSDPEEGIVIFDPKKLEFVYEEYPMSEGYRQMDKTRSQLTDIWKQAHPESNFSPEVQRIINMTK